MLVPLQVIDGFLLNVNLGDALLIGFVLGLGGVAIKKSQRLLTLHVALFGALLLMGPGGLYEPAELSLLGSITQYKIVGLMLLVVSPVLYATADS